MEGVDPLTAFIDLVKHRKAGYIDAKAPRIVELWHQTAVGHRWRIAVAEAAPSVASSLSSAVSPVSSQ